MKEGLKKTYYQISYEIIVIMFSVLRTLTKLQELKTRITKISECYFNN